MRNYLIFFSLFIVSDSGHEDGMSQATLDKHYNKLKPPKIEGQNRLEVKLTFIPLGILSISQKTMSFSVDMAIRVIWQEPRLRIVKEDLDQSPIPHSIAIRLWVPNLVFADCNDCSTLLLDPGVQHTFYSHLDNTIQLQFRFQRNLICNFNMSTYPFDVQKCRVKFGLYADANEIYVTYSLLPTVKLNKISMPPEYSLMAIKTSDCTYDTTNCTSFDWIIERVRTRPILIIFVPSMLLVMISWISFWLDIQAAAPRVALGLTVMLTLLTHFNAAQKDLPAVSTIMALDIWMFTCVCTVFASLVEFAVVQFCSRVSETNVVLFRSRKVHNADCWPRALSVRGIYSKPNSKKIDSLSRIFFPLIFFSFNVYFWARYCF